MPEMQEHFPAGANFTGVPSNEETCFETPGV